ncbi:acyl-CoA dehydrogenase family member 11-like [Babylonia areolata]|uniref:acyl-CoA dehydrogenase family member 11-like n=1 Tax=Babylonia areolata TaxID=304850 RepID=UPI003FD2C330
MLTSTKFFKRSFNVYKRTRACISRNPTSASATMSSAEPEMADREMATNLKLTLPFASARLGRFTQEAPQLGNQYTQDSLLRSYLRRHIPAQSLPEIEADLERFGHRVGTDIYDLHLRCEREPPTLEQTDAWGHRVDVLRTSTAWTAMHSIAAQEGLIALAYERQFGASSRLYQVSKLYLFSPSSGLYGCPLAMADGAAKIIETVQTSASWLVERALSRLTSRDPSRFWTSGQWMTEKRGGSDVAGGTETLAVEQTDGSYRLYGYKWFSSATDADMTFTLARVVDRHGNTVEGTKGLSLFYVELRDGEGRLNNIQVHKLKNKLGTRQLPTAELLLEGSHALRVSEEGRGVAAISNMLTLTRLHNSVSASSAMRRMVNLARDYSTRRQAFGSVLKDYPLHVQTLARMEVEARGASLLSLEAARLLGREEVGEATETETLLLRLLVPVMKLYTAKQAVAVASEGLECFGGQGYIEDTGLPSILRDAQVLTIWEGTTNVLSLDVLRALAKSKGAVLHAFNAEVNSRLQAAAGITELRQASDKVRKGAESIVGFAASHTSQLEVAARDFAFSIARVAVGALLIDHAASSVGTEQDVYAALRWCDKDLTPVLTMEADKAYSLDAMTADRCLVFDGYLHPDRL